LKIGQHLTKLDSLKVGTFFETQCIILIAVCNTLYKSVTIFLLYLSPSSKWTKAVTGPHGEPQHLDDSADVSYRISQTDPQTLQIFYQ